MKRYEIVVNTDNPDIVAVITDSVENNGWQWDYQEPTGKHSIDVALFEIEEDGKSGDALWVYVDEIESDIEPVETIVSYKERAFYAMTMEVRRIEDNHFVVVFQNGHMSSPWTEAAARAKQDTDILALFIVSAIDERGL